MNRYYICRRIGSGTVDDPYVAELRLYIQANYGIKPKQQILAHVFPFVLLKYDLTQAQHDDVMANVTQVFSFPQGALNTLLSDIPVNTRNAINTRLVNAGFDTSWLTGSNTVRDILQYIAHTVQLCEWCDIQVSGVDIQNTTIADLNAQQLARLQSHISNLNLRNAKHGDEQIDISNIPTTEPLWRIIRRIQRKNDDTSPRTFSGRRWFYFDGEAN